MHSALRPKPPVKSPPSLIPINKQQESTLSLKKLSIDNTEKKVTKRLVNDRIILNQTVPTINGSTHAFVDRPTWSLGLVNSNGRYLTSETFGCKINATGLSLKKKQRWIIVCDLQNDCVYLQSALNFYLSTDKYGRLKCDSVDTHQECCFQLEYNRNGQWALKSLIYHMYLGGDMDQIHCFSKSPEWWSPHLALHPQINLKHILRKRYAKVDDDEIHIDEVIPWGNNSILAVEYTNNHYCIRSNDGLYFHNEGKFIKEQTKDTLFSIELYKGYLTFKDYHQSYLTAIGPLGMMTTRNKTPSKDEQFSVEESKLQVCLMAPNGKLVSTKQGIDLSANQRERDHSSIFQIEYDEQLRSYHIRTYENKYWKVEGSIVKAIAEKKSNETGFRIQSFNHGHVTFQALNDKYVVPHATGQMRVVTDNLSANEASFQLKFINRSSCVFKCEFGYVGHRNKNCRILECNKAQFSLFILEEPSPGTHSDGIVYIKGPDGAYWEVSNDLTITATGCEPSKFALELAPTHSRILIKASNGMYLRAEQSGSILANSTSSQRATQWEF